MNESPGYFLTPQAQADIEAIVDYLLAESVSTDTIQKIVERLYEAFALITSQPGIGRKRPEWTSADVRFWSMTTDPYLIIYRESIPLGIVRVWSGRRDPKTLHQG